MSGAEHIDIASAQPSGLNKSENTTNMNVEQPFLNENNPIFTSGSMQEANDSNIHTIRHCLNSKEVYIDAGKNCNEALEAHVTASVGKNEVNPAVNSDHFTSDADVVLPEIASEVLVSTENDPVDLQNGSTDVTVTEPNFNHSGEKCLDEKAEKSHHGLSMNDKDCLNEQHVIVLAIPASYEVSKRGRKPGKTIPFERCALRSSVEGTSASDCRALDGIEGSEPNSNVENYKGSSGKRRGRKSKSEIEGKPDDEYERMRKHLRYLLHRIKYAQNLLDAYSSEGWRGQSLEKLRPEKELQRAKADITRYKLKIRDLFQHLDSILAQGKFPESLYDSDGLIDSEDIFCAKCGSKDLSPMNDIILCDGVCERGFHQYCLEPPLRTEDIPPGDEGWLCPACGCKLYCIDLLNDSQGIKLTFKDNWEKVFPEEAASTVGKDHDDLMGLPSDDSDDNDFNPDKSDDNDNDNDANGDDDDDDEDDDDEGSGSASDSSDFSSASEDLEAITGNNNQQNLGIPSDDSEEDDDDYNPDAANVNEDAKHEDPSSGFSSASENLDDDDNDGEITGNPGSEEIDGNIGGDIPSISGRRHVERLDYKKLYDETYGNANSDTSDDEEWADEDTTKTEKRGKKSGSVSSSALGDNSGSVVTTPKKRGRKKKVNPSVGNDSSVENSQKEGSSSKSARRPAYNKLSDAAMQRLYESFNENQYPDRKTREKLADEIGLTPDKVNKWFGHARWTFNHHRDRIESSMSRYKVAAHNETQTTATDVANDTHNVIKATTTVDVGPTAGSGSGSTGNLTKMEPDKKPSGSKRGRKRKITEYFQTNIQSANPDAPVVGPTQEGEQKE